MASVSNCSANSILHARRDYNLDDTTMQALPTFVGT